MRAEEKQTMVRHRQRCLVELSLYLLCALICAKPAPALGQGQQPENQPWAAEKLAKSPRRSEWITILNAGKPLRGWVVYPEGKAKVPVVLVLHEVFGLTDSTRNTADEIAAMGFIAITPDMLSGLGPHGGGSGTFTEAEKHGSNVLTSRTDASVNSDIDAWADYGLKLPQANREFAIVGLSWGGGAAFRYAAATNRSDLKAVFVFYDIGPPAETQKYEGTPQSISVASIRVPVYGFYGSRDTRATSTAQTTRDAMSAAGKVYEPVIYDGADHAFMRLGAMPDMQNQANIAAMNASLERLRTLLKSM
jgi:carboxymethylenebutenolidase